jgi:hypothetical protein
MGWGWLMFGMLDYRAHKLYKVLVYPVIFVLSLIATFALPFVSYLIAKHFTSEISIQVLLALVFFFLISFPWLLIVKILLAIPTGIFNFLIHPVPAGGRSKDEAKIVVQSGQKGIAFLALNRPAADWSDEEIDSFATMTLAAKLFQNKIRERIYALKDYYMTHPDVNQNEYNTRRFLKENKLSIGLAENLITNPMWRTSAIQALVLLIIFVVNSP